MGDTLFSSLCERAFALPGVPTGVFRFRRRRAHLKRHMKMEFVNSMYGVTGNEGRSGCVVVWGRSGVEIVCVFECIHISNSYYRRACAWPHS